MRVAVQLYGHLRAFRQCAPTLRRLLLSRHDADVFIHTWSRLDATTSSWWRTEIGENAAPPVDDGVLAELHELYAPTGLQVEEQQPPSIDGTFASGPASLAGLRFMLSSMERANALRKARERASGEAYELVVVTRPDMLLHAALDLRAYRHEFERHQRSCVLLARRHGIVLARGRVYAKHLNVESLFFAPPDVIDAVVRAADVFDQRYVAYGTTLPPEVDWPEEAFLNHLVCEGIAPVVYLHYYGIRRLEPGARNVDFKPVTGDGTWRPAGWKQAAAASLYRKGPRWFRQRIDGYLEQVRRSESKRELVRGMAGSPAEAGLIDGDPANPDAR